MFSLLFQTWTTTLHTKSLLGSHKEAYGVWSCFSFSQCINFCDGFYVQSDCSFL